mmetsp:Transcript_3669/g.8469  ORF Transcript_3669/g.8469 Transcript_3669/m.8469 type:complete len:268 (+) Transcript_3669:1872-2675(+)|eukprot:CAMPEP_0202347950 /NCGR_PEP_ID=MMETSP1126-20121109/6093_1 /ASSEMBLY_ACC=CAM_ASM_000457 /TAXON_ID=3047 /ORGANISM="Dunaliella tertiolecta, Strain CCMP1320" /LENGTH=267 /DNA_ID=CAMNT_0048939575 /DNA_START=37 /DNA_END=840 /DNA_ORIENTATION=+
MASLKINSSPGSLLQRQKRSLPPSRVLHAPHRRRQCTAAALPDSDANNIYFVYGGLGLAAASFVGTFFLAPRLLGEKNADWNKEILPTLRSASLRSITPEAAYSRAKKKQAVLIDVRLPAKYDEIRAKSSINVPLFIPIQKWDAASIIRRAGFASFGVYGTELNPNFVEEAKEKSKGRELMVICENGGSIEAKAGNDKGFQSRSLKAIYYLLQEGVSSNKISHVSGGLSRWSREDLPTAFGEEEDEDDDDKSGLQRLGLPSFFGLGR